MTKKTTLMALLAACLILVGCGSRDAATGGANKARAGGETTALASEGPCAKPDFASNTPDNISKEALPVRKLTITTASGEVKLRAEVADSPREMSQGLMFRRSLGKRCGMLFVYPSEEVRSFWMRNTLIPLSIAYIDSEGRIIDLQDMKALDDRPPSYVSAEPAQYALEMNVGFFRRNGVEVGDKVSPLKP